MFKTCDLRLQIIKGRRQVFYGRTTIRAWTWVNQKHDWMYNRVCQLAIGGARPFCE